MMIVIKIILIPNSNRSSLKRIYYLHQHKRQIVIEWSAREDRMHTAYTVKNTQPIRKPNHVDQPSNKQNKIYNDRTKVQY